MFPNSCKQNALISIYFRGLSVKRNISLNIHEVYKFEGIKDFQNSVYFKQVGENKVTNN